MVIRDEGEEFLSEKGDQGGGSLWKSQHLLQHRQHALPTKTHNTIRISGKLENIKELAKQNRAGQ